MGIYNYYLKLKEEVHDIEHTIENKIYSYLIERGLFQSLKNVEINKKSLLDEIIIVFDKKIDEKEIIKFVREFDLRLVNVNHTIMKAGENQGENHTYTFKNLNILKLEDKDFDKILNCEKTLLIKMNNKSLKIGENVWGKFRLSAESFKLEITNIEIKPFKELGLKEAKLYGLNNINGLTEEQAIKELRKELLNIYDCLLPSDVMYCYEFKIID